MWGGNYPLAVASYNAGAGNVRKWVNSYGDPRGNVDIVSWIEKIPFEETRGYVQRVLENSVVYDRLNPTPARRRSRSIFRPISASRAPGLRSAACPTRPPRFITPQGFARIRAEYEQLFGDERPKLVETIVLGGVAIGDRSRECRLSSTAEAAARDRPAAVLPLAR